MRGITYSEFDNKVGPQLKFQYPPQAIAPEAFESFAEYVIVGKHLCGKKFSEALLLFSNFQFRKDYNCKE